MNARFNQINDTTALDEVFQKSFDEPVVIFKHSVTCPISASVYHEISRADADINLVIVQSARNISNSIAEKTGIRHESPQAIVLKDGAPVYHASHFDVTAEDVMNELRG